MAEPDDPDNDQAPWAQGEQPPNPEDKPPSISFDEMLKMFQAGLGKVAEGEQDPGDGTFSGAGEQILPE